MEKSSVLASTTKRRARMVAALSYNSDAAVKYR
jgi:hypothetical protein